MIKTTIVKNTYDEWVARLYVNGQKVNEYFTNDKQDAVNTANDMKRRELAKQATADNN